jgi:hypothetical protein
MKEISKIVETKVIDRTPGGFISEIEITEEVIKSGERFTHHYYLIHDKLQKEMQDFIQKNMNSQKQ